MSIANQPGIILVRRHARGIDINNFLCLGQLIFYLQKLINLLLILNDNDRRVNTFYGKSQLISDGGSKQIKGC